MPLGRLRAYSTCGAGDGTNSSGYVRHLHSKPLPASTQETSSSLRGAELICTQHQFLLIANCILYPFGLPGRSAFVTPLIFILSAIYHSLGELSMKPAPDIFPLSGFFILSGVGCGLEVCFKKVTGRRVERWYGRVWTWFFLLSTGRWACSSWLDSGLAGSTLGFPGPGRWAVPYIAEYLFKVVPKSG